MYNLSNKIFSSSIVLGLLFPAFLFLIFPVKNVYSSNNNVGTLTVCNIMVSKEGLVLKSNDIPPSTFSLKVYTNKTFSSSGLNVAYDTENFPLNEKLVSSENDANCVSYEIPLGDYYYAQEERSNPISWGTPKYFDGLNFSSLSQAKEYSSQLFNSDPSDDILVNVESDGFVSLTEANPNRKIVLVNTYVDFNDHVTPNTFDLVTTSIVCDSESDLPNWGLGGADITASTTSAFLSSHPNCRLASDWSFQYTTGYMDDFGIPADYVGNATSTAFTLFGPTDSNGVASTKVFVPTTNPPVISVREVLKDGYIPFKHWSGNKTNADNYSAEIYCHTDVVNYDNYDVIALPIKDKTYYCVAFNVKQNTAPSITLIGNNPLILTVGSIFTDPGATSTDREDGNLTSSIIRTGTVGTTTGTYTLTYTVTDTGGLSASTTRTVIINPVIQNDTARIIATSIVCDSESDLPNWGLGGADITASTTSAFLSSHPNCRLASDWKYQWGIKGVASSVSDSFVGEVSTTSGWTTFGPTVNGTAFVDVKLSTTSPFVLRQVSKNDFVPFASYNNGNVSAEFYCGSDVFNYDNLEEVSNLTENQTVHCISFNAPKAQTPINTPPVITLLGSNPFYVNFGATFTDPGATSTDREDGDLTSSIIRTGTVPTTPGTYILTYTVTDTGGLSASTTRTVIVREQDVTPKGTVKFCAVFVDKNNTIQTSKNNLPFGNFNIALATTTDINSSSYGQKSWTNTTFAPNQKVMSSVNDADCLTFTDLPLGNYYYSQVSVNGSLWRAVKYNDQYNMPVNNVFDMLDYSSELFNATTSDDSLRNPNSDGLLEVSASKREHTVVLLFGYNEPNNQCLIPDITSSLSVQATLNSAFSYQITASSSSSVTFDIGTSTLPKGLSFATSTGIISGTPTEAGAFFIDAKATNSCGTSPAVRIIIYVNTPTGGGGGGGVTPPPTVITSGGGGGGNGPIVQNNLTIFNEKVVELNKGVALVTWNTNIPATRQVGYGTGSVNFASSTAPFGYATSTALISSPLDTSHSVLIPISTDGTYYFRPVSKDTNRQVIGKELVLTRDDSDSDSCYYLFDYLKKGWNNNPVEVKKLQVFLRDLEGFDVAITGVYDDQTIKALNAFQERYKDDILTPWGHKEATSFTYITTKKKVNEIYCKMAFPLTAQQQEEINNFRNFINNLKDLNIEIPDSNVDKTTQPVIINTNEVGVAPSAPVTELVDNGDSRISSSTNNLSTLAGISTTTKNITSGITASVIQSGKALGNLLYGIFWPFSKNNNSNQCKSGCHYCDFSIIIFIIIIIVLSYLLYRERRAYKKLADVNKELDLVNKQQ